MDGGGREGGVGVQEGGFKMGFYALLFLAAMECLSVDMLLV